MKPFVHLWWRKGEVWPWCRICGVIKRIDGKVTGCRGKVSIATRGLS